MKFIVFTISSLLVFQFVSSQNVDKYYNVIKEEGSEPISFVREMLKNYDLLIFDDALHAAVEPFEFYGEYLENNPYSVNYIFLETTSVLSQVHIDSFLNHQEKDIALLIPVFQQDFNYGWRYETYLMLFSKIWDINQKLPVQDRIKIIGVDQPIYWEGLHTRKDYDLFQKTLISRDYFMYKTILNYMGNFNSGKKGMFLTNTRHAYKGIRDRDGRFYWNAGTFFHQWHPKKTYAIRFHNMNLSIESVKNVAKSSTEGLDRFVYKWVRMDKGLWDKAFARHGNKPVAIPFKGTIFGKHPYIGNHMINILEGQTMYDAYDALIFLKPLEKTMFSAKTNFFCTREFRKEIERRVKIIQGEELEGFLMKNNFKSLNEYIEEICKYIPKKPNPLVD